MGKEEEEKKGGFKVVDHRRFDDSGNERSDAESRTPSPEAARGATPDAPSEGTLLHSSKATEPSAPPEASEHDDSSEITFASFLMSLATQALMQLGEIPPPPGVDLPADREAAKQTIDIISIIEKKTRGNLDPNEQQLMTEVLHNLRMCYVRKV